MPGSHPAMTYIQSSDSLRRRWSQQQSSGTSQDRVHNETPFAYPLPISSCPSQEQEYSTQRDSSLPHFAAADGGSEMKDIGVAHQADDSLVLDNLRNPRE